MRTSRSYTVILGILTGVIVLITFFIFPDSRVNLVFGILGTLVVVSLLFLFKKKWLLFFAISAIPISTGIILPGTGMNISFPSELLSVALALFVSIQILRNKLEANLLYHPLTILLLIDLGWIGISTLFSTSFDISVKRMMMKCVFFLVFYLLVGSFAFKDKSKVLMLFLIYGLGLIPVMYLTFVKHMSYDFDLRTVSEICAPYFNEHTIYAACLAFLIPIVLIVLWNSKIFKLSLFLKLLFGATFLFLISQEILALSRAALISLLAAFSFYLFLKTNWKTHVLFGLMAVLLTVGVIYKNQIFENIARTEAVSNDGNLSNHISSVTNVKTDASNLERINRWICAIEMFKEKPLTGYGPGTYQFEYGQFQTTEFKTYISTNHGDRGNAHSEYLTYLSETGLPGFLIYIVLVFYTIHIGVQNYHRTRDKREKVTLLAILLGLITFFVHGLVNAFIDQDKMAFLVYAAMAAITLFDIHNRKNKKIDNENPPKSINQMAG